MSRKSKRKIKPCLLFPPQWTPFNPHFALYTLAGHLKSKGIDCDVYDVNLQFFHYLFSEGNVRKFQKDFLTYFQLLGELNKQKKLKGIEKQRFSVMRKFLQENQRTFVNLPERIQEAVCVFNDPEKFYDPALLTLAGNRLEYFLRIFSLPIYPASLFLTFYLDPRYKMNFESLKEIIESKDNYFEEYLKIFVDQELAGKDYGLIALSINAESQVLPGLILAKYLRERFGDSIHINIGGNYFTRLTEIIENKLEFFEEYADSMIWGEGEVPFEKLVLALQNGTSLADVPNLIFWDHESTSIKKTFEQPAFKSLDEIGPLDLSQIPLKDYLSPEVSLPIQYSRGCYWGKCTFCDHFFGAKICRKTMNRLIEEIKSALDYGVKKFVFVDEMLSPNFVRAFSERVLKEKLEIHWFTNGRTELGFTKDILGLAYKAGLCLIMWGVESGSKRVMDLINKGVDAEHRFDALEAADACGVWNFAFVFFGFPTETVQEAFETVKCLSDPRYHIDSYGRGMFTPGKQSAIVKDPDKFGITELTSEEAEFCTWYDYKTVVGMSRSSANKVSALSTKFYFIVNKQQPPIWLRFINRDILFLYLCKHGKKKVKRWHFKNYRTMNNLEKLPTIVEWKGV